MKRLLICLASLVVAPAAVTGVNQAAADGQPGLAVVCAGIGMAAIAAAAWITAQVGIAVRSVLPPAQQYRRGRWTGRDGGGW